MRVARRFRPSLVGYGASAGRRRLLTTQSTPDDPRPHQPQLPLLGILIRIDTHDRLRSLGLTQAPERASRNAQESVGALSSARGR